MANETEIQNFMGTFFSTVARQRIEKMIRGGKLSVGPVELKTSEEPLGDHISIIMLWSSVGAVFLKIHFTLDVARSLASGSLERSKDEISREMALDFMKECCNGVGGYVRGLFETNQMLMGMSLPFLAEGVDELIFRKIRDPRAYATNWELKLENGESFFLTTEVCLLDAESIVSRQGKLEEALQAGENEVCSDGEVEFLF